jgi:hypothetical protein
MDPAVLIIFIIAVLIVAARRTVPAPSPVTALTATERDRASGTGGRGGVTKELRGHGPLLSRRCSSAIP